MWTSFKFWAVLLIVMSLIISFLHLVLPLTPKVPSPLMGKPAPDFQVDELNGEQKFSLNEFKGIPIVLNFWASWCAECRTEAVILSFFQKYGVNNKQLVMVGIAIQDSQKMQKSFCKTFWKILSFRP